VPGEPGDALEGDFLLPADGFVAGWHATELENPTQVIADLARLINPAGPLGIIGVYAEKDLHPASEGHTDGRMTVPWVISHHGRLDDAPKSYEAFDRRAGGIIKAMLRP
jgi:glutathione-independent formaldehyde dehydrogenase